MTELRPVADPLATTLEHRELGFGAGDGLGEGAPTAFLRRVLAQREAEMAEAITSTAPAELVPHCKDCGRRTSSESGYCAKCCTGSRRTEAKKLAAARVQKIRRPCRECGVSTLGEFGLCGQCSGTNPLAAHLHHVARPKNPRKAP